ncbi:hypothetical protein K438DRAFT_1755415 [Mycena galopus ATCC 62051]|nr:hypothetical protein K438DRAFT_1755415 [Mycena galopus ATCC 62051]
MEIAKQGVNTAKTCLPTQDDVQRSVTSVGQAAKTYLPQSVAAYLHVSSSYCQSTLLKLLHVASVSFSSLETDPSLASLHLPFLSDLPVTDDCALTVRRLSTEAHPTHVDSLSASFASISVSDAVFGDAPTATQPSIKDHKSAFAPAPVLPPPIPLYVRRARQRRILSPMPAPAAAEDASPSVQIEASSTLVPVKPRCPRVHTHQPRLALRQRRSGRCFPARTAEGGRAAVFGGLTALHWAAASEDTGLCLRRWMGPLRLLAM